MKKRVGLVLVSACALLFVLAGCKHDPEPEPEVEPEVVSYTVTFDSDGGSAIEAQIVEEGKKATKPENPTKEDYLFLDWYNGDAVFDFETPITSNLTLKAKWEDIVEPDSDDETIYEMNLDFGENTTVTYFNSTTNKFTSYKKSGNPNARAVSTGEIPSDLTVFASGIYANVGTDENKTLFIKVEKAAGANGNLSELKEPEVYQSIVDYETSENAFAMDSNEETMTEAKTAGSVEYFNLEVKEEAERPGLTFTVKTHPNRISYIQYFVRNKKTGKVYSSYETPNMEGTFYDYCWNYYFPFVVAGDEYDCYVQMGKDGSSAIQLTKPVVYKTATGLGENIFANLKISSENVTYEEGVISVKNIPDFPTIAGAENVKLEMEVLRGTSYDDENVEQIKWDSITPASTISNNFVKEMKKQNILDSLDKTCSVRLSYTFKIGQRRYSVSLFETEFVPFKFVYSGAIAEDAYSVYPDENGVMIELYAPENAKVSYFYVKRDNGIEINSSSPVTDEKGGVKVLYPFVKENEELTITLYVEYTNGSPIWKQKKIIAGGGFKSNEELFDLSKFDNLKIKLSAGTEDDTADTQIRKIKYKDANFLTDTFIKDSNITLSSISMDLRSVHSENDSWLVDESKTIDLIADSTVLTKLTGDGLNLVDDLGYSMSKLNDEINFKNDYTENQFKYITINKINFNYGTNNKIPGIDYDFTGLNFCLPEKRSVETVWKPFSITPLENAVLWEDSYEACNNMDNLVIPSEEFKVDELNRLTTENYIKISCEYIDSAKEWGDIIITSGSWEPFTASPLDYENKTKSGWLKIDGNVWSEKGYFIIDMARESGELVTDIANNGLNIFTWANEATVRITKVEVCKGPVSLYGPLWVGEQAMNWENWFIDEWKDVTSGVGIRKEAFAGLTTTTKIRVYADYKIENKGNLSFRLMEDGKVWDAPNFDSRCAAGEDGKYNLSFDGIEFNANGSGYDNGNGMHLNGYYEVTFPQQDTVDLIKQYGLTLCGIVDPSISYTLKEVIAISE